MISIQRQFLFIHVPKTGGNSIQGILMDYSEDDIVHTGNKHQDGVERFEIRNSKFDIRKHSTLSDYKSVLDTNTYRSLFKFATIRNPWDMMVSFYFSPHGGVTKWNRDEFVALVNSVSTLRHYICEKSVMEKFLTKLGVQSPIDYTKLDRDIDFLIRFERLDHDFAVLCEKINISCRPLAKRNRSARTHYSQYYDEELKEVVRKKFLEEIRLGGYSFENA